MFLPQNSIIAVFCHQGVTTEWIQLIVQFKPVVYGTKNYLPIVPTYVTSHKLVNIIYLICQPTHIMSAELENKTKQIILETDLEALMK